MRPLPLAFLTLTLLPSLASADLMLGPEVFIDKSIEAHGGAAKIDKFRAEVMKLEGKMARNGVEVDFTGEFTIQLPSQYKNVIRFQSEGIKVEIVTVFNGDKGWRKIGGKTVDMTATELAGAKDTMHAYKVARMTAIPTDRTFTLANLNMASNPSLIDNVRAWGIKVGCKGEKDVVLWIADEKKLLLKLERDLAVGEKKVVKLEEAFGDYKEVEGVQRPTKRIIRMDGKKTMESKATEIKLLEEIDEKIFAKP